MAAPFEAIRVEGLKEFRSALRSMDSQWPRELNKAGKEAATVVATDARSKATSLGGVAAKTAPSIRAGGSARGGTVSLGGTRYPFAMGAEFGAAQNVARNTSRGTVLGWNQFPAWTGSDSSSGRFFWPAIRENRAEVETTFAKAVDRVTARAFPE